MPQSATRQRIFIAPAPRAVADIFDSDDLAQLRALGDLIVHEAGPGTHSRSKAPSASTLVNS